MDHDVLDTDVIVKGQCGSRPPEGVETMALVGNVSVQHYSLQSITDVGVDNLV